MRKNQNRIFKRVLASFLAAMMVLCAAPATGFAGINFAVTANAEAAVIKSGDCGAQGDNVQYNLYDDGTLVISGTGDMADYGYSNPIPPYGDYKENIAGNYADTRIKNVVIENGVTRIGDCAFAYLFGLTDITIPDSVTKIGMNAFSFCVTLTDIVLPESITEISKETFDGCCALKTVELPSRLTEIPDRGFQSCCSLEKVIIPENVKTIGKGAFASCVSMTKLILPEALEAIGDNAFEECIKLDDVFIHSNIKTIGEEAFYCCDRLKSAEISSDAVTLGKKAFGYLEKELSEAELDEVDELCRQLVICMSQGDDEAYNEVSDRIKDIYPTLLRVIATDAPCLDTDVTSSSLTLYGHTGSTIETYASENNLRFAELSETEHTHQYTPSVTTPATCTQTGVLTYTCTCGDSYTEVIPAAGHSFGDFTQTKAPTVFTEGETERICEICGYKETKAVAKLESETATDERTGVTMIYEPDAFESAVTISVAVTENDGVFELDDKLCDKFVAYDIEALCGGVKVQPSKTVWVTVPLPDGFNEAYAAVYYVDENGNKEKMNSFCSDGTVYFEASHFSNYVVVDESSAIEPAEPDEPDTNNCPHICHKGGFLSFIWKIINFFNKLFKINPVCSCGVKHY